MYEVEEILEPCIDGIKYHIKYIRAYDRDSFRKWLKVVKDLNYNFLWLGRKWCSFSFYKDRTDICIIYIEETQIKLSWYDGIIEMPVYINEKKRDSSFQFEPLGIISEP